jgi:hypothetical protein
LVPMTMFLTTQFLINFEGYNSTSQILSLFSKGHQFEFHEPQDHWRFI